MRKNFGPKTALYPMPVLIIGSYDENGKANAMNAAWGGIVDTGLIGICLSEDHRTTKNILKTGAFTVSMADRENVIAADYVGLVSGDKEPQKMEKAGWHCSRSEFVHAPIIEELPMALECELVSYDTELGLMIGRIVNICADERILTEGQIDLEKFHPITYDSFGHGYYTLGQRVGSAFSDGKQLK